MQSSFWKIEDSVFKVEGCFLFLNETSGLQKISVPESVMKTVV